jgi:hypothetical protein
MKSVRLPLYLSCAVAVALFSAAAFGEVKVTLTISGNLDEIMTIVQHLKSMGLGGGELAGDDPLKLNVHSTNEAQAQGAGAGSAPQASAEPPAPRLALNSATVVPNDVTPGAVVTITVSVVDADKKIDTVAASIPSMKLMIDLHDNGVNGDQVAGDGIWSGTITIPADGVGGVQEITVAGFDANGAPVTLLGSDQKPVPLIAKTQINVVK